MELPHGPWRQVLSGVWDDREVSYHESPDKRLLIMIYDKKGEEIRGMAAIMTKFFSVKGNAVNFISELETNTILLQKKTAEFNGTFLGVITDPAYVEYTPRNLINQIGEMYRQVDSLSEEAIRKARDYNLDLIDLEHSPPEEIKELLGEPLALPAALVRKAGPKTVMETPEGKVFFGIDMERKPVKEDVKNLSLAVVSGEETRDTAHVIMEGYILNGIAGLIFDSRGEFAHMDSPNRDMASMGEYGSELEPLSMPVRNFTPGADVFIDISCLNEKLFADIAGISDSKTTRLIGKILAEKKTRSLSDIAHKLSMITEEEDRYYAARGARICRLLDNVYPKVFNGPTEAKEILAPWMKRIGRIAHVNSHGLDERIVKGIIYSVLRTVYEELKKDASREEIRIGVLLEGPSMVSGKGSYLDLEINALVKLCTTSGIGICIRTPNETSLDKDFLMNATARISCMEDNQLSIKTQTSKPYRVHLRPTLSAP